MSNQIEPSYAHARSPRRRVDWIAGYLLALENNGGNFKKAAEALKVAYSTVWERRKSDPVFARSEDEAVKRAQRFLESEAVRRATEGNKRIRFQPKTGKVYHDIEFSDLLLLRLLEKNETGSWRRNHVVEQRNEFCFKTRAERLAALEKLRIAMGEQQPVAAVNRKNESEKANPPKKNAWARSGVSKTSSEGPSAAVNIPLKTEGKESTL